MRQPTRALWSSRRHRKPVGEVRFDNINIASRRVTESTKAHRLEGQRSGACDTAVNYTLGDREPLR
jgi:hypothetical protein